MTEEEKIFAGKLFDARIYIGDNVMFGPNVSLMATNHPRKSYQARKYIRN